MQTHVKWGRVAKNMSVFRSDSPLDEVQIANVAPSIFADHAHESRGERYAFIPTSNVLAGLKREGFEIFEVRQTRTRDEGKRDFTKHLVRMRHPDARRNDNGEVPEIVLVNSHDGSSSYQLIAGIFRMICCNGLIAGDLFEDIRIRHSGNVVDDVIEGSFRVVDSLGEVTDRIDDYKALKLDRSEQLLLAHAAADVRWDRSESPVEAEDLNRPRRFEDRKDDLWTTFNRVQENVIKGGVAGRTRTNRRMHTREVTGVNENVRLNRALWTLADRFAALKRGETIPELEAVH